MKFDTKSYLGPSFSSTIVDLRADGLLDACSMISLRTITSAKEVVRGMLEHLVCIGQYDGFEVKINIKKEDQLMQTPQA